GLGPRDEPELRAPQLEGGGAPGHAARHHGRHPRALPRLRRPGRRPRQLRQGRQYRRVQEGRRRDARFRSGMTDYATILTEQRGAVTLVTLNRPEALNALSSAVLEDLIAAFAVFEADEGQRCAVMTGAGEKAFAAGADIKEMADKGAAEFFAADMFARWSHLVRETRKPWIAAVN